MKLMGHRGARHEAPENTLLGIETALKAGVEAIEIDVHLSADGRLIVIHDDTVDRTTDGTGKVVEMTAAELQALDAGQGERVPTLEQVLEAVRDRAELFIEIKAQSCEAEVVRVVQELNMRADSLVKAFDHRIAQQVKRLDPGLRTGCLLYGRPVEPAELVLAAGADFISVNVVYADALLVDQCHDVGVKVCAWNCNRPEAVATFREAGVDWLGTDVPTLLLG